MVEREEDLLKAWSDAQTNSRGNVNGVILEEFIDFDYEFTLLTVRKDNGENVFCLPIGHIQSKGDYQSSWQPLEMNPSLINEAKNQEFMELSFLLKEMRLFFLNYHLDLMIQEWLH